MKKIFYLIVALFFFVTFVKSQNSMMLVSGKKLNIGDFKLNNADYISYKNQKGKIKSIERFDVFSITAANGKETIIYRPEASDTAAFTVVQMRDYVRGVYDARNNYKTPWISTLGFMIGGGSVGLSAIGMSTLLVPVLPISYDAGIGIFKIKKEKLQIPNHLKRNPYYTEGYLYRVNRKRINHAILGTITGIAIGTLSLIIFSK